jgi:dihydroorotase
MASDTILLKGPRVIDPVRGIDELADILIKGGNILATKRLSANEIPEDCQIIQANNLVASPGFIDVHCHLREPGFEYKETIATGSRAAARGGFTTICCMPNTSPPIDNVALVNLIRLRSQSDSLVRVFPIGCISKGRDGKKLAEMEELAVAGVVAFSDDGDPVYDPNLMRLALTYSRDFALPIINHCQDRRLSAGGVMAEGWVATRLGLPGISAATEEVMIARDITLAELTGGRLHLAHLSSAGSVGLLRQAKERGVAVTGEVTPHHLTISDQWVLGTKGANIEVTAPLCYDTNTKVFPPLRQQQDIDALVEALVRGDIDCIATDHAPHDLINKQLTYQDAAFGISVLETALGSVLQLVHRDQISLSALVERMTVGPARVLGPSFSDLATLRPGTPADITLFDPNLEWVVDPQEFASKGRNTPLEGTTLKGRVVATLVAGHIVFRQGQSELVN